MSPSLSVSIPLKDESQTTAFGQNIAPLLDVGDVVLLSGPIGAGKTHLARAIIQARLAAADRFEDVPSPTYTLVQTYHDDTCEIWHADLYRITGPDEVYELGLLDAFDTSITLIEWPDRMGDTAPSDALNIALVPENDGRVARMTARAGKWSKLKTLLNPAS